MDSFAKIIARHGNFKKTIALNHKAAYEQLANGQSPEILFITCSDSRVDPSFATQADPGDLFVMRNAGNIIPVGQSGSSELGTIQFAVEVLGVKHIVVCGHSDCGAVKAMLKPESVAALPALSEYLCTCTSSSCLNGEKSVEENVKAHTKHQCEELAKIDFVKTRVDDGKLHIHAWMFDIASYSFETHTKDGNWVPVDGPEFAENSGSSLTESL